MSGTAPNGSPPASQPDDSDTRAGGGTVTESLRIVGIGASAGGIEALRGFFQDMPPPPKSLAFVVVLHLSPDRTSMLAEVLRQWTDLPVRQATDGTPVA